METAAVLVALFILAAVVRFASREITRKEPAMNTTLSTNPGASRRAAARRAYAGRSLYAPPIPVRLVTEEDEGDAIDFDFVRAESKGLREMARLDAIAHQDRIPWADLTDTEIGYLRKYPETTGTTPRNRIAVRASVAWSKRYSRAVRAAKRGDS